MRNKNELLIAVIIFALLSSSTIPILFDSDHRAFLEHNQKLNIQQGDVIVLCVAEQSGDYINYRLVEIWRNRFNDKLEWSIGELIPELRDNINLDHGNAEEKIVFYKKLLKNLTLLAAFLLMIKKFIPKLILANATK